MRFSIIISFIAILFVSCTNKGENSKKTEAVAVVDSLIYKLNEPLQETHEQLGGIDLGKMKEGEVLSSQFFLRNNTKKPLIILGIKGSCGCVTVEYDKKPIAPGKCGFVKYNYDSKGKNGIQVADVEIITTNSKYTVALNSDVK